MPEALKKADEVLQQSVQGITDLINVPALINLDFADVQTVMRDAGIAHIGIGSASGDEKANEAVQMAVTSPLLETTIEGAKHVIVNITGDVSLFEANEAASYVQELAGEDAISSLVFAMMIHILMNVQLLLWLQELIRVVQSQLIHLQQEKQQDFWRNIRCINN